MLPVTDAMVLSTYADATLIIVAAGRTRRAQLQRTAERFAQAQAPVIGMVLNEVSKENGYVGGYGYSYGYGSNGGYAPYQPDASLPVTPARANGHPETPPAINGKRGHRAR